MMNEVYTKVTTLDAGQNITQVVETEAAGAESSVEISQNSKGMAQVCVKVYHLDPVEAASQAVDIYRKTVSALQTGATI